jgi:hypothetical protein
LQSEMNLAAWWSGLQLLLAAFLMYERSSTGRSEERWPWAILAFIAAALSASEIGSIHERLGRRGNWTRLFVLAVILGLSSAWALWRLVRQRERRRDAVLVFIAFGLFVAVAGMEYLESVLSRGIGQDNEEGTELVAFLVLLVAAAGHRRPFGRDVWVVIPNPGHMVLVGSVLAFLLLPHMWTALRIAPYLTDLYRRGNPIVWWPFAAYALLACQALTVRKDVAPSERGAWGWLAFAFVLCSIGMVFPFTNLTPHIELVVPRWIYEGRYATYIWLVPPVLLVSARALGWQNRRLRIVVAAMALLFLVHALWRPRWLDAMVSALVAYLWTLLFLPLPGSAAERVMPSRSVG